MYTGTLFTLYYTYVCYIYNKGTVYKEDITYCTSGTLCSTWHDERQSLQRHPCKRTHAKYCNNDELIPTFHVDEQDVGQLAGFEAAKTVLHVKELGPAPRGQV